MALRDAIANALTPRNLDDAGFSPLTKEHKERRALFEAFWRYYRGHHRKALKVRPGQADDNVTLNYSRRVVDKGVQFLFGKPVTFEIDDTETEGSKERTPEEEYLDLVWGSDETKQTLLQKVAKNGGVCGTAVVRLYEPEAGVADGMPRIVNLDPALLDVLTDPDDIDTVRAYFLVWKSDNQWKRHRIDMQPDGTWYVTVQVTRPGSSDWAEVAGESAAWPYPFAPIITAQNLPAPNEFWGIGDLEEADINDALNFAASNALRIIKFHAHPKTIGTGFNANDLQNASIDDFWTIADPLAKVANLEMQSDLTSTYNMINLLKTVYSKVTNVPDLDPSLVNVGALSGFALRILYGDLLEVTQVKRNTYGAMLSEINQRLLALGGRGEYGAVQVKNEWQDPLPSSGKEEAEALKIDRENGLSKDSYLTIRGHDPDEEREKRKADQDEEQAGMGRALTDAMRGLDQEDNGEMPMRGA